MVETLALRCPVGNEKTLVVIDAGISTEENLNLLKAKGFNYLCENINPKTARKQQPNKKYITISI
jgi:hypothetical protein